MSLIAITDVPLDVLASEIKARITAGDRAADKAADHFRAAGLRLLDAKKHLAAARIPFDGWLIENDIGRSRAYELIGIAKGTKTLAGIRASTAERVARHAQMKRETSPLASGPPDLDSALVPEVEWLRTEVGRLMEENRLLAENGRLRSKGNMDAATEDDDGPAVSYFDRGADAIFRTEFSIEFRQTLVFSGYGDEPEAHQPARYLTPVDFQAAGGLLGELAAKEAIKKIKARKKQEARDRR
ncbi:hypothetical protein ACVWXM_008730 [Bradyrhizobium sp. GM7.3]